LLRRSLLMLSRSDGVKHLVSEMPVSSGIVARFVAGESVEEAVDSTQTLVENGLMVTLDYLGEDTTDRGQAHATVDAYVELLKHLPASPRAPRSRSSCRRSARRCPATASGSPSTTLARSARPRPTPGPP
jgi:proline dehydrogenase